MGQGKEIIHQAHSEHRDACLFHQHRTGPQKQTEQQEEGRSGGRETFPNMMLVHAPGKQDRDSFNLRRNVGH